MQKNDIGRQWQVLPALTKVPTINATPVPDPKLHFSDRPLIPSVLGQLYRPLRKRVSSRVSREIRSSVSGLRSSRSVAIRHCEGQTGTYLTDIGIGIRHRSSVIGPPPSTSHFGLPPSTDPLFRLWSSVFPLPTALTFCYFWVKPKVKSLHATTRPHFRNTTDQAVLRMQTWPWSAPTAIECCIGNWIP